MHPRDQPAHLPLPHLAVHMSFRVGADVEDQANHEVGIAQHASSQGEVVVLDFFEKCVVLKRDLPAEGF